MGSFDRVYRGIFRKLYEGELLPGQRLVAPALAQEFNASRNTVREVLTRLSAVGVIAPVRNQSPTVRALSRSEMEELLDVVGVLLGLAARSAARRIGIGDNGKVLQSAYDGLVESEVDASLAAFVHARERYYRAVLAIGGNRELIRLFPTMHVHLMRMQLRSIPLVAQSARFSDYAAINAAILAGDPVGAATAAERHVEGMTEAVKGLPDSLFAREAPRAAPASIEPG